MYNYYFKLVFLILLRYLKISVLVVVVTEEETVRQLANFA